MVCYKVILGEVILGLQNSAPLDPSLGQGAPLISCGEQCCKAARDGGLAGFGETTGIDYFANWDTKDPITGRYAYNNYVSDPGGGGMAVHGPGMWIIAILSDNAVVGKTSNCESTNPGYAEAFGMLADPRVCGTEGDKVASCARRTFAAPAPPAS